MYLGEEDGVKGFLFSDGINLGLLGYLGYLVEGDGRQGFVLGDGNPLGYLGDGEGT